MAQYDKAALGRAAKEAGFNRDMYEKTLRLRDLLAFCGADKLLCGHLALKGGAAINMTIFDLPRLSSDLDMDFVPNLPLEETRKTRDQIARRIAAHMEEEGYLASPATRRSHCLDALRFQYLNAGGNRDNLGVEINYSLRAHLFPPARRRTLPGLFDEGAEALALAPVEIFAAKLAALLSRAAARDLFDVHNMVAARLFEGQDLERLRKGAIFYASLAPGGGSMDAAPVRLMAFRKIRRELFPALRASVARRWLDLESRKRVVEEFLADSMAPTPEEAAYMENLGRKVYRPELLFQDEAVLERVGSHPMIAWRLSR